MTKLGYYLRSLELHAEQLEALHVENRRLKADLEAIKRVNASHAEELLEARELLLEHSHGDCARARGNA